MPLSGLGVRAILSTFAQLLRHIHRSLGGGVAGHVQRKHAERNAGETFFFFDPYQSARHSFNGEHITTYKSRYTFKTYKRKEKAVEANK